MLLGLVASHLVANNWIKHIIVTILCCGGARALPLALCWYLLIPLFSSDLISDGCKNKRAKSCALRAIKALWWLNHERCLDTGSRRTAMNLSLPCRLAGIVTYIRCMLTMLRMLTYVCWRCYVCWRIAFCHPHSLGRTWVSSIKALLRLYWGSIKALLRLYEGSIKPLLRLYQGFIKALLRVN
jgi:hypothetical protein